MRTSSFARSALLPDEPTIKYRPRTLEMEPDANMSRQHELSVAFSIDDSAIRSRTENSTLNSNSDFALLLARSN